MSQSTQLNASITLSEEKEDPEYLQNQSDVMIEATSFEHLHAIHQEHCNYKHKNVNWAKLQLMGTMQWFTQL